MNYFIEGIQGSGKTTMLEKMTQDNPKLKAYREGDFSPVELAWCAYVSHSQYEIIIKKYANLAGEIKKNTVKVKLTTMTVLQKILLMVIILA